MWFYSKIYFVAVIAMALGAIVGIEVVSKLMR
jgi:hypothetical protein